jgi:hypothetical protein
MGRWDYRLMAGTEHTPLPCVSNPPPLASAQRNSVGCRPEPRQQDLEERKRAELSIWVIEIVVDAGLHDGQPARKQLIDEHREPIAAPGSALIWTRR